MGGQCCCDNGTSNIFLRSRRPDLYSTRITIGDTTWERLLLDLCGPDSGRTGSGREGTNAKLRIDRFPRLLKSALPDRSETCRYSNWELLHLRWDSITPAIVARAFGGEGAEAPADADFTAEMDVWIWSDSRIAKVEVVVNAEDNSVRLTQTFANFDGAFQILDPRNASNALCT